MVGEDGGDITLATSLTEEDAEVFRPGILMVGCYHEADDDHDALHCDERTPKSKLIA